MDTSHYSDLQVADCSFDKPGPLHSTSMDAKTETESTDLETGKSQAFVEPELIDAKRSRCFCGLRPATFWIIVLLAFLVIGAAIGGGIGGSLTGLDSRRSGGGNTELSPVRVTITQSTAPTSSASASAPSKYPPAGCNTTHYEPFILEVVEFTSQEYLDNGYLHCNTNDPPSPCEFTLTNGALYGTDGRLRFLDCDDEFIYTANASSLRVKYDHGFPVCANMTLAFGESTTWYYCPDGSALPRFYDAPNGGECFTYFFAASPP